MSKTGEVTSVGQITLPGKYDIIPIHASDRAKFKACRRAWDYSSPARQNLAPRADVLGVYVPFFFGTGIHYGLEQFYTPGLSRDPVEAFKTWYSIMWDGGIVTADWLDKCYDLNPHVGEHSGEYVVRGLRDILPEGSDSFAEIDELLPLGVAMLENYKRYAAVNDGFEVISSESEFSVPIWDYANDCILTALDTREQSPNYGKRLEVHARGRRDMLYRTPSGKIGIFDHKTAERQEDSDMLNQRLESDEQITTYMWATEIEAQYYGLPYAGEQVEEAIYQVLRKAVPTPPTIVKSGIFSVDRQKESTTWPLLKAWMEEAGVRYVDLDEKHQGYVDWLREIGDEQFFVRKMVRRNRHQLKNAGYRIYQEATDMLGVARFADDGVADLIYPNLRRDWSCLNCAFRPPCLAKEAGEDYQYLIDNNYSRNKSR